MRGGVVLFYLVNITRCQNTWVGEGVLAAIATLIITKPGSEGTGVLYYRSISPGFFRRAIS